MDLDPDWATTKSLSPSSSHINPSLRIFFYQSLIADFASSFLLNIINVSSRPDLYFARPCGYEHLKTIYWWNLLLLSGIAGHYFQNFIIRVFQNTHIILLFSALHFLKLVALFFCGFLTKFLVVIFTLFSYKKSVCHLKLTFSGR